MHEFRDVDRAAVGSWSGSGGFNRCLVSEAMLFRGSCLRFVNQPGFLALLAVAQIMKTFALGDKGLLWATKVCSGRQRFALGDKGSFWVTKIADRHRAGASCEALGWRT